MLVPKDKNGKTRLRGMGYLWTKDEFSDFELSLEYKLSPGANSGIFYRTDKNNPVNGGFEIQLMDNEGAVLADEEARARGELGGPSGGGGLRWGGESLQQWSRVTPRAAAARWGEVTARWGEITARRGEMRRGGARRGGARARRGEGEAR